MPMTEDVPSTKLRRRVLDTLGQVEYAGRHVGISRYDQRRAVVVPDEWYRRACEALGETARLGAAE